MGERGEVEVLLPLTRIPSPHEQKHLVHLAFDEARRLVEPTGGRVLGLRSVARAEALDGSPAMRCRFAVRAPEANFERPLVVVPNPS